ncbi:MAG: hypothetical protein Q4F15_02260 [Bacillota bacterium]|nr:hypothetical protein [Bacillota bacterium]
MKSVTGKDLYEVRKMGLYSSSSLSYLSDFYGPLIGASGLGCYLTLLNDPTSLGAGSLKSHDYLFTKSMLSPGELYKAMESLEGAGLLRSFLKSEKNVRYFVYELYPPKTPEDFSSDVLLSGTLRKYIGEADYEEIVSKYRTPEALSGFDEVTATFQNVFRPDFDDPAYKPREEKLLSERSSRIKTDFDFAAFNSFVQKNGIEESSLSKSERKHIAGLANLYGISPESLGEMAVSSFDPKAEFGHRLDLEKLDSLAKDSYRFPYLRGKKGSSQVSGDSALATKIKMMDQMTPTAWLTLLSGNRRPPESDLRIIQNLSLNLGVPSPVINAVVDYVLATNDNILSALSCEKLSMALVREGVDNARDAMESLNSISVRRAEKRKQGKTGYKKTYTEKPVPTPKEEKREDEEEYSEEEIRKMLDSIYND